MPTRRLLAIAAAVLAAAWLIALALLAIGTFGLFGQERDPLAAVFLIPLGLPWNLLLDRVLTDGGVPVALLSPAVNIAILLGLRALLR